MKKHAQITQNNKITIFHNVFTISQKEIRDEVDFLHVDKHQSSLQVYFNTLGIKLFYKVVLSLLLAMIKHSQYTQSCHICCLCSKLMFFKKSRLYCSKSNYTHQTSPKKACIRSCDTNNFTQSLHECTTIMQLKVYIVYVVGHRS